MQKMNRLQAFLLFTAVLASAFVVGCSVPGPAPDTSAPTVVSTEAFMAVFSEAMDPATIVPANFTMVQGTTPVSGTVSYDAASKMAVFTPTALVHSVNYTATITTGVKDAAGNAMAADKVWTFTTGGPGPAVVLLGTAGNYVVLAKAAITNVPASVITGNIGISPAAETYITGFSQTDVNPGTGIQWATSPQVTGKIYAADMVEPTKTNLTTAVLDMQTAYTDAAGRPTPDFLNLGSGNIGGKMLVPGLYKWGSSVTIPSNVTLVGGANDVWIFQMTGDLLMSGSVNVFLCGGAQAKNVFWQLAGQATMGTYSHFQGIILTQTAVTLQTGSTLTGRALAQTQVALQKATVTAP